MRLAVCVKHVPSGRGRLDPATMRLDRTGPGELNRFDRNAVEEVVRLKERIPNSEVLAVSMGPAAALETLRTALALGADRAVLVCDAAAEGCDLLGTARVLAAVLEREHPDLVVFGQQSEDGGGGVLMPAIADLLRLPFVSQASELKVDERVRVTRQTESGDEILEMPLPALVSVGDSVNEPRYTSLKGVMAAKRKPLETVTLSGIGVSAGEVGKAGAQTVVLGIGPPPMRANGVRIEDESVAAVAIMKFLADRQIV